MKEAKARRQAQNRPATAPRFAMIALGARLRRIPRPGKSVKGNSSVGHVLASCPRREP
jgi:hypothetical protein